MLDVVEVVRDLREADIVVNFNKGPIIDPFSDLYFSSWTELSKKL